MNEQSTLQEVERLFVDEAALLDSWSLEDWLGMLTEDVRYLVPSLDSPNSDPRTALFLIADDSVTLRSRVRQLMGRTVWSENPRSRTRRLVTNVRVIEASDEEVRATANFAVWRFHAGSTDTYVGTYKYLLTRTAEGLKIRERRAVLDMETLRPHGKLSFIL